VAILIVLSTAGCGSHTSASPHSLPPLSVPTTTVRPTSQPTASANPANVSPEAAELAAATAVVRRYYAIANNLRHDMNFRALEALFTSACYCQAQARSVREAAALHEHYIDQAHLNVLRPSSEGIGRAYVLVNFDAARGGLVKADGTTVTSIPPKRHVERVFRLEHFHRGWLITSIEFS
jgi:hypothetical protein